jgi:hypothetical protein
MRPASTWLLATNLPDQARSIVEVYRRRVWCEEAFRVAAAGWWRCGTLDAVNNPLG